MSTVLCACYTLVAAGSVMDEADLLGDRIAIISRGSLRVLGSSLFLKGRFGIGYHLVISTEPSVDPAPVHAAVSEVVRSHVPLAAREESLAAGVNELSMLLPLESISMFAPLFAELEERQQQLSIVAFGVSITSLEEVFLRLAEVVDAAERNPEQPSGRAQHPSEAARATDFGALGRPTSAFRTNSSSSGAQSGYHAVDVVASSDVKASVGHLDVEAGPEPAGRASHGHSGTSLGALLASLSHRATASAGVSKQIKTQLWRRFQQAKRDRRGVFLQCVFPLMFVAISFVFRSLNSINAATNLATITMSPTQFLAQPQLTTLPFLVNSTLPLPAWATFVTAAMSAHFGGASASGVPQPQAVTPASGVEQWTPLESDLLSMDYAAGSFVFNGAGLASSYDLTLLANTSFTNSVPILVSLYSSALLRQQEGGNASLNITSGYAPFPRICTWRIVLCSLQGCKSRSCCWLRLLIAFTLVLFLNTCVQRTARRLSASTCPRHLWASTCPWDSV